MTDANVIEHCCECGRPLAPESARYRDLLGAVWHELCYQRRLNIAQEERAGDESKSERD
jgi:hypothetical protein